MIQGVTVDYGGAPIAYGARQKESGEVIAVHPPFGGPSLKLPHIPNIQHRHRATVVPTATSLFRILFRAGVILGEQKWVSFAERRR